MKKIYRSLGAIALGWFIGSCGDSTGPQPPPPPPTTAIVVMSDGTASVVPAATVQLSATAKDASGQSLSRTLAWSSSDPAKATVSQSGLVTGVGSGSAIITAAVDGKSATSSVTVLDGGVVPSTGMTLTLDAGAVQIVVPPDALASNTNLWIVPSTAFAGDAQVIKGTPFDFLPTGTNFAKPVSVRIKYSPANLPAGTEEAALQIHLRVGTAWQVLAGSTVDTSAKVVTAVLQHFSTYAILTPAPVAAVTIRGPPEKPLVDDSSSLVVGDSDQLSATLTDSEGAILSNRVVTWTTSDPSIASVTATGLVTAISPGSAIVKATAGGISASVTITVIPVPVSSVTVSLSLQSIFVGQTSQATAVLKDLSGNALTGRTVTWSSSNTAVATVDANGLVTAVAAGDPVTITGTSETKSGTSSITVTLAPVNTVAVSPASATLVLGVTPTQQLSTQLKDINNNVLTGRTVTWSSSNTAVATVDANGLVTAVAAGDPVTITATSETKTGTSSIAVTPTPVDTVAVSPASASLVFGITPTQQLTAQLKDAHGAGLTGRTVTWSSGNAAVATVDANGLVTAVAVGGPVTITATSETKTGTSSITVVGAPVNSVTVTPPSATLMLGVTPTQQLSAQLKDANDHLLSGRTVTWTSSNNGIATVDANGLVTAVAAGGPVTITAASEGKSGTSSITVTIAPVTTVTLSPPTTPIVVRGTQQLTATPRDAAGNALAGRTVNWVSSNTSVLTVSAASSVSTPLGATVTVTAAGLGMATITATSETAPGATTSITVTSPPTTATLLHKSDRNGRYFENAQGRIVYLTGSHTWSNLQDNGTVDPPAEFNYPAYLDFLTAHNHNFIRLWAWEQSKWTAEITDDYWITPGPYARTGDTPALDGKPKFDLTQFNQAYFDRLRQRVIDAGSRGVYVSVMLFDGWSIATKEGSTLNDPWKGHPFNAANNVNGIDGDVNGDGLGLETEHFENNPALAFQEAYVRKVIDEVGDLDNVLYEISNEGDGSTEEWQGHMIQVIRSYEATKPKQHPVGMTAMFDGSDGALLASGADWISSGGPIAGDINEPATASGSKVLITDTDHVCGVCGNVAWVWKSLTRGHNPILMDPYDDLAIGLGARDDHSSQAEWEAIRTNMGYARGYAERMDLASAVPRADLASTGYALVKPGAQYLVFIPGGGSVTVDLSAVTGSLNVEWFNPATGVATQAGTVAGGPGRTLSAPFGGDAVLFLH